MVAADNTPLAMFRILRISLIPQLNENKSELKSIDLVFIKVGLNLYYNSVSQIVIDARAKLHDVQ